MAASPNSAKSDRNPVILLGLGFTTRRLARRLLLRDLNLFGVSRNCGRFADLASLGLAMSEFDRGPLPESATIVHTIPPLPELEADALHDFIASLRPKRILYISSTGVYGNHEIVNETTLVDASNPKARARIDEEKWILSAGEWESLVVRPAAIYGPFRGVHRRIAGGELTRASGPGMVSRIHVDDLAGVLEAGIGSGVQGTWPLADDRPCSSDEINRWCANLLRKPLHAAPGITINGRAVNGTAIRKKLEIALTYPDFESGILASLAEEGRKRD